MAAFHRKLREGAILVKELRTLLAEFDRDSEGGAFGWLPVLPSVVQRLLSTYASLTSTVAVRAADAIHLPCAAEAGYARVFSNDARLLMAAPHFGVVGENVL